MGLSLKKAEQKSRIRKSNRGVTFTIPVERVDEKVMKILKESEKNWPPRFLHR